MKRNSFIALALAGLAIAGATSSLSAVPSDHVVPSGIVGVREPQEVLEPAVDTTNAQAHQVEAVQPLVALVGHGESDTVGSYNAANNGRAMDLGKDGLKTFFGRDCSEVTIGEILLAQDQGRLHAVGRYQVIGITLPQAIRWAGLSGADLFTPENQDRIFLALIQHKRPAIWDYLSGESPSVNAALMSLAREWASMPTLAGVTYYGAGDRAHATVHEVVEALNASRSRLVLI